MNLPPIDPLERLRRTDRWTLGSGDGVLFAPSHPLWLDRPGFWDGVQWLMHEIRPGFTTALIDADGRQLPLRLEQRAGSPAELLALWSTPGLRIEERRAVLPRGCIAADWSITADEERDLHVVAWTAVRGEDIDRESCRPEDDGLRWVSHAADLHRTDRMAFECRLGFESTPADGSCIVETQHGRGAPNLPDWSFSPCADLGFPLAAQGTRSLDVSPAITGRRLVHLALAARVRIAPGKPAALTMSLRLRPLDDALALDLAPPIPPGEAAARSREHWNGFADERPALESDDPFVDSCFAFRWAGLRLNFLPPLGRYAHPTCAEGTGPFHAAISYSAWCHARELRWLSDPTRARGALRTFFDRQHEDGSLPGILYAHGEHPTASYFADWGGSLLAVDEIHPDAGFLEESYAPLTRLADHMLRDRDPERTGLYEVHDPYETGQEYMSRYTAVDDAADQHHFDYRLRLQGVDITVYVYRLRRALARIAARLGRPADARAHDAIADAIGDAVRNLMWDDAEGMFSDVDPRTGRRTGVAAAVCFYPYMTDIAGPAHLAGLRRNLFDPDSFWPRFPVPSTALDDPLADAEGRWRGVRRLCPWNGRVWPMTNSHLIEALGVAAGLDPTLRARAAHLMATTLRMLCLDRDPARPTSYEHYSPITGRPALHRGLDDYQHSFLNDLTIRWVAGFRPTEDGFVLDPLPLEIERLKLDRLPFRGARMTVEWNASDVNVTDGTRRWRIERGQPLHVRW